MNCLGNPLKVVWSKNKKIKIKTKNWKIKRKIVSYHSLRMDYSSCIYHNGMEGFPWVFRNGFVLIWNDWLFLLFCSSFQTINSSGLCQNLRRTYRRNWVCLSGNFHNPFLVVWQYPGVLVWISLSILLYICLRVMELFQFYSGWLPWRWRRKSMHQHQ